MYEYWYYYEMDSLDLAETGENEEHCDWDTWGGQPQNDAVLTSDNKLAPLDD